MSKNQKIILKTCRNLTRADSHCMVYQEAEYRKNRTVLRSGVKYLQTRKTLVSGD